MATDMQLYVARHTQEIEMQLDAIVLLQDALDSTKFANIKAMRVGGLPARPPACWLVTMTSSQAGKCPAVSRIWHTAACPLWCFAAGHQ
jgi:hypothetical protein